MTVHFICRGNVLRSIIAEAYLNSLQLPDITVVSSGTVADEYRVTNHAFIEEAQNLLARHNLAAYAKDKPEQLTESRLSEDQTIIFMNSVALDEAKAIVTLPVNIVVWDIVDIGEGDRIVEKSGDRERFQEVVFAEITAKVDELVKTF
jgi:protein-tyrosine-phosphatase